MKDYPPIPHVEDAADLSGHVWLVEKIDGALLRFQLQESGLLRFGTDDGVYDDPDAVPLPYQHAVQHVRDNLDRDALRRAVDDVTDIVFFGEATHHHTIPYDWDRIPSFLGFDIWSVSAGRFRPPDVTEKIFEQLGLQPVNVFERERRMRDFDPDSYEIPDSAWYDGPADGVIIRSKQGQRAQLHSSAVQPAAETTDEATAAELAERYATTERFERLADTLSAGGQPVTAGTLADRAVTDIVREQYSRLYLGPETFETKQFRSTVATLTRAFLDDWPDDAW